MQQFKSVSAILVSVIVSIILAGCGGGGGSDLPAKPKFTSQVSFGDSLSDVGSYNAAGGPVAAAGGGQFTINSATSLTNWTQLTAASLGLGACAASTGGYGVAPSSHAGCFGYAQGGARVTLQPGVGNTDATLVGSGAMTVPVGTQIANHLTAMSTHKFSGDELVLVMAGANDVFTQAGLVGASLETPASAVAAVATAATELAADVNAQLIANGATHVVVANIPDIGKTPYAATLSPAALGLVNTLVTTFNTQLKAALPDSANVLNIDAFTASGDEVTNPAKYNLSNVTTPACNIAVLPGNSSLFCTSSTLIGTADAHFLYADSVHPTPYGHALFATYVLQAMTNKGWY